METSVDVLDWNQKREIVKNDKECGSHQLLNTVIDQNGMCGKAIRKNKNKV
jgi:hypothetical protein